MCFSRRIEKNDWYCSLLFLFRIFGISNKWWTQTSMYRQLTLRPNLQFFIYPWRLSLVLRNMITKVSLSWRTASCPWVVLGEYLSSTYSLVVRECPHFFSKLILVQLTRINYFTGFCRIFRIQIWFFCKMLE